MFIQVPESVNKSLRNGISPRTEIHFPNSSLVNRHPRAILADDDRLRNEMFARRECDCGADGVTMPVFGSHWIPWRPPMFPSHESYRRSREVCNNLSLTPCSSPSRQSVTGVTESVKTAQKAVAREEVETPTKEVDHNEEDEIESIGSPRSFASSGSASSRDDMLNQFPEIQSPAGGQTPAPKLRSQQPNPWGRASYSDLITMAITSTGNNMMTLSEIYSWIVKNVPYFNDKGTYLSVQGWKNAVRHTLSLRKRFIRVPDPKRPYKSMWTISSDYQRNQLKQKRRNSDEKRGHFKNQSTAIKQELRQPMDLDEARSDNQWTMN